LQQLKLQLLEHPTSQRLLDTLCIIWKVTRQRTFNGDIAFCTIYI